MFIQLKQTLTLSHSSAKVESKTLPQDLANLTFLPKILITLGLTVSVSLDIKNLNKLSTALLSGVSSLFLKSKE